MITQLQESPFFKEIASTGKFATTTLFDLFQKTTIESLKQPATIFAGTLLTNAAFKICNQKALAVFLTTYYMAEKLLGAFSGNLIDKIATKERIERLKEIIDQSQNLGHTTSSLTLSKMTFVAAKILLVCNLSSSIAQTLTGKGIELTQIAALTLLMNAALVGTLAIKETSEDFVLDLYPSFKYI